MKVFVPKGNIQEKQYVFHVLFHVILNIECDIFDHDGDMYELQLDNGNVIRILDAFWTNYPGLSYLDKKQIKPKLKGVDSKLKSASYQIRKFKPSKTMRTWLILRTIFRCRVEQKHSLARFS